LNNVPLSELLLTVLWPDLHSLHTHLLFRGCPVHGVWPHVAIDLQIKVHNQYGWMWMSVDWMSSTREVLSRGRSSSFLLKVLRIVTLWVWTVEGGGLYLQVCLLFRSICVFFKILLNYSYWSNYRSMCFLGGKIK